MDIQFWPTTIPLRVMMINPLVSSSRMVIVRMLSGLVFGKKQLIDMTLLVYSNEIPEAQGFIQELIGCNFGCLSKIVATSDLPSITDADVYCFMSNFANPNLLDFNNLDTDDQFDCFYLLIKVAYSLGKSVPEKDDKNFHDRSKAMDKEPLRPIIVTDGLVVLDILNIMISKGNIIPSSSYRCAAGIPAIAKTLLSEYLKVQCNDINNAYVWGANDHHFHIEIEKPFVVYDTLSDKSHCDWEMVSKELLDPIKLDHTQFNASWMKKEFIEKITHMSVRNPYGPIFKAWKVSKCLTNIWDARSCGKEKYYSMGVISDGSLRTKKGLPYFLPIIYSGDTWTVNDRFEELPHVRQEIKRFNGIAKCNHDKLVKYCNKFLEDNVINQRFVPPDDVSESAYTSTVL